MFYNMTSYQILLNNTRLQQKRFNFTVDMWFDINEKIIYNYIVKDKVVILNERNLRDS